MTEYGWQLQRTPDGASVAKSDGFMMRAFSIIVDVKNTMMIEARNKR